MADTKISALPAATTPLAGTEVLPIVQSGTTKQVSVANLTAGSAISATSVTASTGNFVVGTSGQGVDFSTTPGTGTSELLADYEEGTWTPTDASGAGLSFTIISSTYTKIGRQVTCFAWITYPVTANGSVPIIGGLPYVAASLNSGMGGTCYQSNGQMLFARSATTSSLRFVNAANADISNASLSGATFGVQFTFFV